MNTNEILTVNEVAGYLRLSPATIYRLVREKMIPGLRVGRAWRFRCDLIDQWMADQWQERTSRKEL